MPVTSNALQINNTANSATLTESYTVPAGDDRVLVVRVMGQRGAETNFTMTATWNGQSMSEAVTVTNSSASRWYRTSIFYLTLGSSAGATTANLVVTASVTLQGFVGSMETLTGVDQTTPVGATGTDAAATADSSVTLSSVTPGSYIVGYVGSTSAGSPTWSWTGVTEDSDQNNGSNNTEAAGSGAYYANTGTGDVTFLATRSAAVAYAAAAAEFLAAASGMAAKFIYYSRMRR